MTKQELIEKATILYGNKFSYESINNEDLKPYTLIPIHCEKHGLFFQTVYHHLNGVGCPKCKIN